MQYYHTVWYSLKQSKENWYKYTHVNTLQYMIMHIIGEHTFIQWSISASMLISVCLDNIVSVSWKKVQEQSYAQHISVYLHSPISKKAFKTRCESKVAAKKWLRC